MATSPRLAAAKLKLKDATKAHESHAKAHAKSEKLLGKLAAAVEAAQAAVDKHTPAE